MACYFPLWRLDEKYSYLLPSNYRGKFRNGGLISKRFETDHLFGYAPRHLWQQVPCGTCIGCRLEYSRQWAIRCLLESRYHDNNYFVTLTYDDEHLPLTEVLDPSTGLVEVKPQLVKRDFQLFMKRLRASIDDNLRFYACGEYGSLGRPHYHVIIFGGSLDLKYHSKSQSGAPQFHSDQIAQTWKNGLHAVSEVNFDTCAYVARYCMKKEMGMNKPRIVKIEDREYYMPAGGTLSDLIEIPSGLSVQQAEFCLMSRRPGIGRQFYVQDPTVVERTFPLKLSNRSGVMNVKPARYFDKLYDIDYPDRMQEVKEKRKYNTSARQAMILRNTTVIQDQLLLNQFNTKYNQLNNLHRDL